MEYKFASILMLKSEFSDSLSPPDPLSHKGARGSRKRENPLSPKVGEGWPKAGVRGLIFPRTEQLQKKYLFSFRKKSIASV